MDDYPRRAAHLATRELRRNFVLIGRSSRARLATWYASRRPVGAVLCLGYPFRHPSHEREPERFRHLAEMDVQALICQGLHDEYGGANVFKDYTHSPAIRVHLLRADHYFTMSQGRWDAVARLMLEFCQKVLPRP